MTGKIIPAREIVRMIRPRISLYPKLAGFYGLFDVSGNILLVGSGDRNTSPPHWLRSRSSYAFRLVFDGEAGFKNIVFHDAQVGVGDRKVRIEFDGMFEKRNRRRPTLLC